MSKDKRPVAPDPDEALRLLEESLSYYSPTTPDAPDEVAYEDLPVAA